MYKERCGHNDNGRVKTWLPYRSNRSSTDLLLHDVTQEELLGDQADKYYVSWYQAPEVSDDKGEGEREREPLCGSAYFGLVKKYKNIWPESCEGKKCTACELRNSLQEKTKLSLRGLCKLSSFDTTYTVQYSPDSMVYYVGVERTVISYNFTLNIWTMRDVTNPNVTAVSEASLRSLAIGNINWTISNDLLCSRGKNDIINN